MRVRGTARPSTSRRYERQAACPSVRHPLRRCRARHRPRQRDDAGHILIDVGDVLVGEDGLDAVFKPVIEDIKAELGGKPLDLYVMTHGAHGPRPGAAVREGEGGPRAGRRLRLADGLVRRGYYDADSAGRAQEEPRGAGDVRPDRDLPRGRARSRAQGTAAEQRPRSTGDCVAYLRGLAGADETAFVHREADIEGTHPFEEAKLAIWGPEENTADYYRSLQPLALAVEGGGGGGNGAKPSVRQPATARGVDAARFYDLVDSRRTGLHDDLLAIDKAANNASIVFSLEWRGWKLLFPGDAEQESWRMMDEQGVLEPVHLLKIAHHGSWNRTPQGEILDKILPPHATRRPQALCRRLDLPRDLSGRSGRHDGEHVARPDRRVPHDPRTRGRRPLRHRTARMTGKRQPCTRTPASTGARRLRS